MILIHFAKLRRRGVAPTTGPQLCRRTPNMRTPDFDGEVKGTHATFTTMAAGGGGGLCPNR
jgi:hypothetical protein